MAPRTPVILGLLAWMGPIFATICQESSVGMASGGMRTLGDGEIEVKGKGSGLHGIEDSFYFVHKGQKWTTGSGKKITVTSHDFVSSAPHSQSCLMIRESLEPHGVHASICVQSAGMFGLVKLIYRPSRYSETKEVGGVSMLASEKVSFTLSQNAYGEVYAYYTTFDGQTIDVGKARLPPFKDSYVGYAISGSDTHEATGRFDKTICTLSYSKQPEHHSTVSLQSVSSVPSANPTASPTKAPTETLFDISNFGERYWEGKMNFKPIHLLFQNPLFSSFPSFYNFPLLPLPPTSSVSLYLPTPRKRDGETSHFHPKLRESLTSRILSFPSPSCPLHLSTGCNLAAFGGVTATASANSKGVIKATAQDAELRGNASTFVYRDIKWTKGSGETVTAMVTNVEGSTQSEAGFGAFACLQVRQNLTESSAFVGVCYGHGKPAGSIFGVTKAEGGVPVPLNDGWKFSPNPLELSVVDDPSGKLKIKLGGTVLALIPIPFSEGFVGLSAASYDSTLTIVNFDASLCQLPPSPTPTQAPVLSTDSPTPAPLLPGESAPTGTPTSNPVTRAPNPGCGGLQVLTYSFSGGRWLLRRPFDPVNYLPVPINQNWTFTDSSWSEDDRFDTGYITPTGECTNSPTIPTVAPTTNPVTISPSGSPMTAKPTVNPTFSPTSLAPFPIPDIAS
ncbi:hypothetical protein AAMO2058_000075900 [Amorphochlora amoebiformis]